MPSTLAHLGAQTFASRAWIRQCDLRWIALGLLAPDLPWIGVRLVRFAGMAPDPYDLRLFAVVQSSLVFSALLCAAFAALSAVPARAFAVMAANATLHLGLDALEQKWGNGVILAAPVSWEVWSLAVLPSESPVWLALGLLGLGVLIGAWRRPAELASHPRLTRRRLALASAVAALWVTAPVAFLGAAQDAGAHAIAVLREPAARPGKAVSLERIPLLVDARGQTQVRTWAGELLAVEGVDPSLAPALVSLRGRFRDAETLDVEALHRHVRGVRDAASVLGLAGVALLLVRGVLTASPSSRPGD